MLKGDLYASKFRDPDDLDMDDQLDTLTRILVGGSVCNHLNENGTEYV